MTMFCQRSSAHRSKFSFAKHEPSTSITIVPDDFAKVTSNRSVASGWSKPPIVFISPDPRPTYEEVVSWATSFDILMANKGGQKIFAEFLKSEFSDENILFWQACEELKNEVNGEKIEEKARIIYEDFISILSPKEVSLDSRVREIINTNMVHPSLHTFDEAQTQIYTLMQRDSYPRFVGCAAYKKLLQSYSQFEEL